MDRQKLHCIYGWLLTALLIALGLALILSCLSIYHSGDRPYSPASISAHFQKISLLVYITVAAVVIGIILNVAMPGEGIRQKAKILPWMQLQRLQEKAGSLTGEFASQAAKEQTLRKGLKAGAAGICILLSIYPTVYLSDSRHFTVENLNADVIKALAISFVPAIIGLGLCYLCRHLCDKSLLREVAVWKAAIKDEACSPAPARNSKNLLAVRCIVFVIAIGCILAGIFNGSAADVLLKAIAICTECIGLG